MRSKWSALARDYDSAVLSPFLPGVNFPLHRTLRHLVAPWRRDGSLPTRVAVDVGCGTGPALPLLARYFPLVIGIDFAPGMIKASLRRTRDAGHQPLVIRGTSALAKAAARTSSGFVTRCVLVAQADLYRVGSLDIAADVVLAINSALATTAIRRTKQFEAIARLTRSGGVAIFVLPALDGLAHLVRLHEQQRSLHPVHSVRWDTGIVKDGSGVPQKYYVPSEIRELLDRSGFRILRMKRITYPWRIVKQYGWGAFHNAPPTWDWYVEARRG
jgi:SAM-dependent methyltransferase